MVDYHDSQDKYNLTVDFLQALIGHRIVCPKSIYVEYVVENWFADTAADERLAREIIEGQCADSDCPVEYESRSHHHICLGDLSASINYIRELRRNPPSDIVGRWY